jgi:hypothetical protein
MHVDVVGLAQSDLCYMQVNLLGWLHMLDKERSLLNQIYVTCK